MPRTARVQCPGGVFHVVTRFARDEWWLEREGAREAYLEFVGSAVSKSDTEVLAYCLMSNHVHLVLVQGERSLERFMKSVQTGTDKPGSGTLPDHATARRVAIRRAVKTDQKAGSRSLR